jgi:hypothetical protein
VVRQHPGIELVEVFLDWSRGDKLLAHALQSGAQHHRKRQVRVARRVRAPQLDTGTLGLPRRDFRDPD